MPEEIRSIEDREARIKEIDQRLAEIDEEYANELMPESTRQEWNDLNAERDEHAATVTELRARRERLGRLAAAERGVERSVVDTPEFVRRRGEDEIFDLTAARFASRSDEEYRDRLHDNARRVIERSAFPGSKREAAQARAAELLDTVDDERGTLARRIIATGSPVYERAFGKAVIARSTSGLSGEEQRALSLGSDADGGYAVPFQLDPTVILTDGGSTNPLRQIARVERIVGKEWQGITSEGVVATRTPEVQEATDDAPDFDQPTVRPSAVHAFVPFSMDLDADWPRLRTELRRMLERAKENEEAESFINGDGELISGGGHNPEGIVAGLPAGSEVDDGGSFTSETLYEMEAGEDGLDPGWRANARWLANKAIYNLVRQFGDTDGADLWVRLAAGQPSELIGYPAHEASRMSATPTGRYLVFGDFSEFLIVDRVGMNVELVPHVFGASRRMPTGQRGIYARWRNSTKILVPEAFRVAVAGS
ncbi:phage major capsid protein [Verrucosispora sp. WMMD1129]|uniref:phage major capsid protein n=1 Tax=Verrucosispora sp. WMMD1129 TaxID=3016093 RepID=UPI00249B4690|nr:phage major capsid protein [Verrucosispora sp. WMMD1129]WFE45313.1 phage major capsid protein [Verrucosispora sp. WMMD1129]